MAKTNFSIAVDETRQGIWARREWRIIQEVGYGESNKEIAAKLFCQKEPCAITYQRFLAKLNLRDRTQ